MRAAIWDLEISRQDYEWQRHVERETEVLYHDVMAAIKANFDVTGLMADRLAELMATGRKREETGAWILWEDYLQLGEHHMWVIVGNKAEINKYFEDLAYWNRGDD